MCFEQTWFNKSVNTDAQLRPPARGYIELGADYFQR